MTGKACREPTRWCFASLWVTKTRKWNNFDFSGATTPRRTSSSSAPTLTSTSSTSVCWRTDASFWPPMASGTSYRRAWQSCLLSTPNRYRCFESFFLAIDAWENWDVTTIKSVFAGNTKEGSITVPLTSCLTGLESAVWQLTIVLFICKTD